MVTKSKLNAKRFLCVLFAVTAAVLCFTRFLLPSFGVDFGIKSASADSSAYTAEINVVYGTTYTYKGYCKMKEYGEDDRPGWNEIAKAMSNLLSFGADSYERSFSEDESKAAIDLSDARKAISNAYYHWYETSGFERTVMAFISGARVTTVELQFSAARKASGEAVTESSIASLRQECEKLSAMLKEDAVKLAGGETDSGSGMGAWATFIACYGILVREGLEAILIVGAMVAYLIKTNNKSKVKAVYIGSAAAIAASFLAAWLLSLLNLTGMPQEIIEGVTALLAGLGGQVGLTIAMQLDKKGVLKKYGVRLLGTNIAAIKTAEDRELFRV